MVAVSRFFTIVFIHDTPRPWFIPVTSNSCVLHLYLCVRDDIELLTSGSLVGVTNFHVNHAPRVRVMEEIIEIHACS